MIELLEELERRSELVKYIDTVIATRYKFDPNHKIHRGTAQNHIISEMGLIRNNFLCSLINDRMKSLGFSVVTIRGTKYFRNISLRPI